MGVAGTATTCRTGDRATLQPGALREGLVLPTTAGLPAAKSCCPPTLRVGALAPACEGGIRSLAGPQGLEAEDRIAFP